tara:strand:- start:674 stop:883 length:210 start_codon:yes stop_codon:yes gene_type:complete
MKITKDNFVWKLLTEEQAEWVFFLDIFELYELLDDDSERLVNNEEEIKAIFEIGGSVGIEVGHINKTEN